MRDGIPDKECCEYCCRRVKEHSFAWLLAEPDDQARPDEEDNAELAWGVSRLFVLHIIKEGVEVKWAGMKWSESVCNSCWEAGKRFGEKNKKKNKK